MSIYRYVQNNNKLIRRFVLICLFAGSTLVHMSCGTFYRLAVGKTISNMKDIRHAEEKVKAKTGNYCDLSTLLKDGEVSTQILDGGESGYIYDFSMNSSGYSLSVRPVPGGPSPDGPFFFLDQSGIIRSNQSQPASVNDEAIGNQ